MQIVPARFPTADHQRRQEIVAAYKTGRGRLHLRARTHFEDVGKGDRQASSSRAAVPGEQGTLNRANCRSGARQAYRRHCSDACATNPTRRHARGDELKRRQVPEILLNNLYAQTPWNRCSASTWWRSSTVAAAAQPEGMLDAFCVSREVVTVGRYTSCARPANAAILEGWRCAGELDEIIAPSRPHLLRRGQGHAVAPLVSAPA